jgi:hypothetical protein
MEISRIVDPDEITTVGEETTPVDVVLEMAGDNHGIHGLQHALTYEEDNVIEPYQETRGKAIRVTKDVRRRYNVSKISGDESESDSDDTETHPQGFAEMRQTLWKVLSNAIYEDDVASLCRSIGYSIDQPRES